MLFTSLAFLFFFPVVCVVYYLLPLRFRWVYLLFVSYYFYVNWQPAYALLLFTTTITTYFCGRYIDNHRASQHKNRWALRIGCLIPLGILFFYKYYNFINASVFMLLDSVGIRWLLPEMKLLMPVGISFYTFMAISYVVDVYKGTVGAERNFGIYALFVSFFPQVTSGPIGRADALIPQLKYPELLSHENVMEGLKQMLWGYFMKLCIADRVAIYVDAVYANLDHHNGTTLLLASILYTFQIYCDFAGYSLIAIGAARIMGIRLAENFRRPYLSRSIREFWGRWHITLSTWFRDYVYIPLGGNRVPQFRHLWNLMVTFLVSGLWHGAAWTFILWGGVHGFFQIIETLWRQYKPRNLGFEIHPLFKIAATFACVNFAWIFFRTPDIQTAWQVISVSCTSFGLPFTNISVFTMGGVSLLLLIVKELHEEYGWGISLLGSRSFIVSHLTVVLLAAYIVLFGVLDGGQFIYSQF